MKISICIPTIRPEGAARCIEAVENNIGLAMDEYEILQATDLKRDGCPIMLARLVEKSAGDWVCFLGDDTLPQPGFMAEALAVADTLPDGWGLVGFNDMFHRGYPPTHWLGHKKLLPLIGGEFFHTGYKHCYCDNELADRALKLNRYKWAERAVVLHLHPIIAGKALEGDYERVYADDMRMTDLRLYTWRCRHNWTTEGWQG